MGVDCHAMPRWLTTPLAASAASFHPSNAAIATGLLKRAVDVAELDDFTSS